MHLSTVSSLYYIPPGLRLVTPCPLKSTKTVSRASTSTPHFSVASLGSWLWIGSPWCLECVRCSTKEAALSSRMSIGHPSMIWAPPLMSACSVMLTTSTKPFEWKVSSFTERERGSSLSQKVRGESIRSTGSSSWIAKWLFRYFRELVCRLLSPWRSQWYAESQMSRPTCSQLRPSGVFRLSSAVFGFVFRIHSYQCHLLSAWCRYELTASSFCGAGPPTSSRCQCRLYSPCSRQPPRALTGQLCLILKFSQYPSLNECRHCRLSFRL